MIKEIKAKYKGVMLYWYFSGKYWYCTQIPKKQKVPVGSGNTKDEAFKDLISLMNENANCGQVNATKTVSSTASQTHSVKSSDSESGK